MQETLITSNRKYNVNSSYNKVKKYQKLIDNSKSNEKHSSNNRSYNWSKDSVIRRYHSTVAHLHSAKDEGWLSSWLSFGCCWSCSTCWLRRRFGTWRHRGLWWGFSRGHRRLRRRISWGWHRSASANTYGSGLSSGNRCLRSGGLIAKHAKSN